MAPLKKALFIFIVVLSALLFSSCSDEISNTSAITVNGTVVNNSGFRLNNVSVSINRSVPVKTNQNGEFSISNISKPYDVTVFNDKDSNFTVYAGLTGSEAVLTVRTQYPFSGINSAELFIKHPKVPAGKRVLTYPVCFDNVISGGTFDPSDSLTQISIQWPAAYNLLRGKLPFLICSSTYYYLVYSYDNFGIKDFSLSDNQNDTVIFSAEDISFNPPEIETQISIPSGTSQLPADIFFSFQNSWLHSQLYLVSSNNFTGGKIMVPGGLGLNYNVLIHSYDFGLTKECSMLITPGSNGTVEFGPDEHLIGPPMDTTGVNNNTQFYYSSNVPGAIYTIEFYDEIYGYRVEINTTAANVKLPDLSIFGKYLPSNQRIHWQVTRRTGYNGINDLASWTVCKNPVNSILYNYSENRSFTTAPR